jgi:hypothetical protein
MKNFYLTLSSNSSMEYFSDNKTSNFTVKLPQTLTLDGKWSVALVDIHYQHTFNTVSEGNNKIFFNWIDERFQSELVIQSKNYNSMGDLLTEIISSVHSSIEHKARFIRKGIVEKKLPNELLGFLDYNEDRQKLIINDLYRSTCKEIIFQNRLALILGYIPNENALVLKQKRITQPNLLYGIPDEMFVYCDNIEPQVIGHKMAQVLRIVSINKDLMFGETHHTEYQRLQYIPLLKKEFENISIELRDRTGKFMPFMFGNTILVLHFRKEE